MKHSLEKYNNLQQFVNTVEKHGAWYNFRNVESIISLLFYYSKQKDKF